MSQAAEPGPGTPRTPCGAESQPVLVPPPAAAVFLVAEVLPGGEKQVRETLGKLHDLARAVAFRVPDAHLTCVAGLGAAVWPRLFRAAPPRELHPFQPLEGPRHRAPATPGDLLLHIRGRRTDMCFELARVLMRDLGDAVRIADEVHGFKSFDDRDLLQFVDGTANPTGNLAERSVLIGEEDPAFRGGSYVVVQKYLHDLSAWEALTDREQALVIGRSKMDDVELPDEDKPADSHVTLNTVHDDHGQELKIVRENMPFGEVGRKEFGTYFIGYARSPATIEEMLRNMFLGRPEGTTDRILDFSTAVTGGLFHVPSQSFLDDLPPAPR